MSAAADLEGRAVLVTGARGFLGSNLCRALLGAGALVHGTSREPGSDDGAIHWDDSADLTTPEGVRGLLDHVRPELVYHFAGSVSARPDVEYVLPTYHSLLTSAVNLLVELQAREHQRLVLIGSLTEPRPGTPPGSPYAAAKAAMTAYAHLFRTLYTMPCVVARPFMVFGPGQAPDKVLPSVIRALLRGEAPKLSSGAFRADWIYVDDVVDGLLRLGRVAQPAAVEYDLGRGELASVRELVETIVELIGADVKPAFGALPDRPAEQVITADLTPIRRDLAWTPTTPLREGLRATIEWYKDQG